MTTLINPGDKLHVMTRRLFADDIRRHFAGQVLECDGGLCMLEGYVYVHQPMSNDYVRRPDRRRRLLNVGDAGHIINVLPAEVDLGRIQYRMSHERRLVLTDGSTFSLDINEFGAVA